MHTELLGQRFTLYNNTIYNIHYTHMHYTLYIIQQYCIPGSNPFGASEFVLGFICNCSSYFTTAKISFTPILQTVAISRAHTLLIIFLRVFGPQCTVVSAKTPNGSEESVVPVGFCCRACRSVCRLLSSCLSAFVVVPVILSAFVVVPVGFSRRACHPVGFCRCACRLLSSCLSSCRLLSSCGRGSEVCIVLGMKRIARTGTGALVRMKESAMERPLSVYVVL